MKWFADKETVAPYSALAPIYDQVMQHVDYDRWATFVHQIIQQFLPHARWIVDVSCGTATCLAILEDYGYDVTGLDSSLPMIQQAARKNTAQRLLCADLVHVPLSAQADVVISLYDSMNYLLDSKSWSAALCELYRILKKDGLFIFDVSTLYNSKRDFAKYVHRETFAHGRYFRKSTFDKKQTIQNNYFEIKLKNRPGVIFHEHHQQRIRSLNEIIQFIKESPFSLLAGYREFTFEPFDEACERVHFVLKKESDSYVRTA